jgi:hypothetical protein
MAMNANLDYVFAVADQWANVVLSPIIAFQFDTISLPESPRATLSVQMSRLIALRCF